MIHFFNELTSTIDEARRERYSHGDVVWADHQTAGRGQRGKSWSSPGGENLLFSVVLEPVWLAATEQFALLRAVALAGVDTLAGYGIEARVKWPNDIYAGGRKITGVLIDHSLGGVVAPMLSRSGVGVGINVNQREFDPRLPNPTSMALEAGREFDRRQVLERFLERLMARIEALREGGGEAQRAEYHSLLWRLDTPALFSTPDGERFTGTIRGVEPTGELRLETAEDGIHTFLFHEISHVIDRN